MTTATKKELSWTPRRFGALYCSPACGAGCTFADYDVALKNATVLADFLGPDWSPRVWENMGWHHSAKITFADGVTAEVYPGEGKNEPWCDLQIGTRQFAEFGETAKIAFEKALTKLREHHAEMSEALAIIDPPWL